MLIVSKTACEKNKYQLDMLVKDYKKHYNQDWGISK